MIYTILISIDLLPDYLIMSSIIIMAHWIWIFGIKKGDSQSGNFTAKKGYQTGGTTKNSSLKWSAEQEASIIIKPSLAENFIVSHSSNIHQPPSDSLHLEEIIIDPYPAEAQKDNTIVCELSEKQAACDIMIALQALAEGKLDANEVKMLNEIAAITVATDKQYPHLAKEVKEILTSPAGELKDIPFIN